MVNITAEAKAFLETEEGNSIVNLEIPGIEYLDIDIVDFSDQNVTNLFDDKYVVVYIIKDLDTKSVETLKQSYYERSTLSSSFYPQEINDKLKAHYGPLQVFTNKQGESILKFDRDLLDYKREYKETKETSELYIVNSVQARDVLWEPLTSEDRDSIIAYAHATVDGNLEKLLAMETTDEKPYAVNVFNDSVTSFISTYSTYEECKQLLERIHSNKIETVGKEMVFAY